MYDVDASDGTVPGTTATVDAWLSGSAGQSGVSLGMGTGQQGHSLVDTSNSNPFTALYTWLKTPFSTPMSPATVFLLVGVVLVAVLAWNMILFHIRIAAESV